MSIDARNALQRHFGYDQFRPGQEAVIDHLLAGHSTAAVFPTGAGKSLCYQLPALLLPGVTLVISPLIALMKDQIDSLTARCIAAARLDSTLNLDQYREVMERVRHGQLRLHQALDLAGRDGCQTAALGAHFAERMEAPCGHCQWCRGGKTEIPPRHTREIPEDIWPGVTQMVAENGEVLAPAPCPEPLPVRYPLTQSGPRPNRQASAGGQSGTGALSAGAGVGGTEFSSEITCHVETILHAFSRAMQKEQRLRGDLKWLKLL